MTFTFLFASPAQAVDVTEYVLRHARAHTQNYTIGPFDKAKVMSEGLTVDGDTEQLAADVRKRFPSLEVRDGS